MSYCPNCGRQILDESLGCPVCNVRNNIDPTKKPVPTEQTESVSFGDGVIRPGDSNVYYPEKSLL